MDGQAKKSHICELCGKVFAKDYSLQTHIKITHEKIKRFQCEVCKKDFSVLCNLNRHVRMVHNKEKSECEICGKMLSDFSPRRIESHMNMHKGLKPHKCKFCGQGFADNSNKLNHEKSVHLGIKRSGAKKKELPSEVPLL